MRIFGLWPKIPFLEFLASLLSAVPDGGLGDCLTPHHGRRRARNPTSDSEEPRSIPSSPSPPAAGPCASEGKALPPFQEVSLLRQVECFRRVNSGGECGAPRGRGAGIHGVRGDSGGVSAREPGISPDFCPCARPSPPVFTVRKHSVSAVWCPEVIAAVLLELNSTEVSRPRGAGGRERGGEGGGGGAR